jgi:hypothetical protein
MSFSTWLLRAAAATGAVLLLLEAAPAAAQTPATDTTQSPVANSTCAIGCTCALGYESASNGTNCVDIDECASSPCYNNGTCTDSISDPAIPIDTYACTCVPGYRDLVRDGVAHPGCAVLIAPCALGEDGCSAHSTCFDDAPGVYHCECHFGYSSDSSVRNCSVGDYPCMHPIPDYPFIAASPTDAGGDLNDPNGGGACLEINECASSPCQHYWRYGSNCGTDNCQYLGDGFRSVLGDGECDDGSQGGTQYCPLGSDCTDCGNCCPIVLTNPSSPHGARARGSSLGLITMAEFTWGSCNDFV